MGRDEYGPYLGCRALHRDVMGCGDEDGPDGALHPGCKKMTRIPHGCSHVHNARRESPLASNWICLMNTFLSCILHD
jgi:hypothetical protein